MMKHIACLALALLIVDAGAAAARKADPGLLKPSAYYDPITFLPPPPADGSARALAELAEVQHYQATTTPEERAAAKSDNDNENGSIFASVLGPAWDLSKLPATDRLVNEIVGTEDAVSDIAKKEFHRKRPWVVDPSIETCAHHKECQNFSSYPSGHSTLAYAMGIVLAHLMPNHAQEILGRSAKFAENRLVCGFHFRSDIVAGQQFGTITALRLMRNPKFHKDMAAAKKELKAAGLSS